MESNPIKPALAMSAEIKIICFFMKITVYSTAFYLTDASRCGLFKYILILVAAGITGELIEREIIKSEKRFQVEQANKVLDKIVSFINKKIL